MHDGNEHTLVGKPLPLKDGVEKVTGSLRFGVDVVQPRMAFGKILRSPHPHARIKQINAQHACALSGVLGIVTHQDAPNWPWENCWHNYKGRILDDTVRFVGDEVAAVAAESERIAEAALQLIEVEYEILTPVFDPVQALDPESPQVRSEGNAREPLEISWGEVDRALSDADFVAETGMSFASQAYAPIGRNACVASWEGDRVTVWTSTQTPSEMRAAIARGLGLPIRDVRVIAQPSGCSFGLWWIGSLQLITALLAKKVDRPVKIELDQTECFSGVKRRHSERSAGRIGCDKEGRIQFIEVDHIHDNGGYGMKPDVGFLIVDLWGGCPSGRFKVQGVSTNRLTAGCMRGVGDVTLGAFVERLLDMAAIQIDMDPLEFRLKNHIRTGDPLRAIAKRDSQFEGGVELPRDWPRLGYLSSEALHECLIQGARRFGWEDKWVGWGKAHDVDGPRRRGIGVATGIHCCGTEDEYGASALIRVHADGSATLCCSMGRQGQGSETTQAQIAAETLGVGVDRIRVEAGDTDVCPPNHGSIASNTAYRTGFATRAAAKDAKRQILDIAAKHLPRLSPDDLDLRDGTIYCPDDPGVSVRLEAVISRHLPDSLTYPVVVGRTNVSMPPSTTYARHFAAHFVEVEVDVDTGEIRVLDYVAAQDSGTVLNPKVLENQVLGGAILSSGFALMEGLSFEATSGEILNPGFLDYKVVRMPDFPLAPQVILCESDDPVGPFGAKGAGEAPAAAPIPAISQAVYNAIGVWLDIPMTPERVLKGLGKI